MNYLYYDFLNDQIQLVHESIVARLELDLFFVLHEDGSEQLLCKLDEKFD